MSPFTTARDLSTVPQSRRRGNQINFRIGDVERGMMEELQERLGGMSQADLVSLLIREEFHRRGLDYNPLAHVKPGPPEK